MEVTTIFDSDREEYEYMQEQDVEKAIEEIATIIAGTERVALDVVGAPPSSNMLAKAVYFAGYRKQEWISVAERLPENGGMYLVYNPSRMVSKVVSARYSKSESRWCSADACCYHEGITHWMPLPDAPKGGAE